MSVLTDFLRENAAYVVAWLPICLAVGAVVSAIVAGWLHRRPEAFKAHPRFRNTIRTLAGNVVLPLSLVGLFVAFIPMSPLFNTVRKVDGRIGESVPDLTFLRLSDAVPQRLSDFQGQVVLVNLWATWCPPCREEMPTLNDLQERLGADGLVVITLSDEPPEALTEFLAENGPSLTNGSVESLGWLAIEDFRPLTLLIDRDGILRDYMFGSQKYETFAKKVGKYL